MDGCRQTSPPVWLSTKSAFRWQATAHFYLIRRKFSKLAFSEQEKVFIKAQKIRPTKSKIFVGLILMPPHPIGIAFSGKSWYTASKNNVDNCRAFCRCDQRNSDFANCRNDRRFCFNGKMLISLITTPAARSDGIHPYFFIRIDRK